MMREREGESNEDVKRRKSSSVPQCEHNRYLKLFRDATALLFHCLIGSGTKSWMIGALLTACWDIELFRIDLDVGKLQTGRLCLGP